MEIVDQAKQFIIDYFERNNDQKFTFHTLEHTLRVVNQAEFIGNQEELGESELAAVLVAAWFHDSGYMVQLKNHEEASIDLVRSFFNENPKSPEFIRLVEKCILVTKRDREPQNLPEKVILDADISHITDENFIIISKNLRKERSNCEARAISPLDYWQETLAFLEKQQFYTSYAQTEFQPAKERNVERVKELIAELQQKPKTKGKSKERSTSRGVESMFRLTGNNQMRLSAIADKKANILISINSILLSVSAVVASAEPSGTADLIAPVIILFIASLLSLVFAILSCRPHLGNWKYSEKDIKERKVNLLFFGNFFRIPYLQYDQAVKEMMDDYDYLYSNMIRDQYSLGLSLTRKYKLLRMAYNIFMYGFILAAIVFAVNYLIKGQLVG
jgi:HD superfamily phosphodiesterase